MESSDGETGGTLQPPATVSSDQGGLTLDLSSSGGSSIQVTHAWIPQVLPAIRSGSSTATADGDGEPRFNLNGLDGLSRPALEKGRVDAVPGAPENVAIVDLESALRGVIVTPQARTSLWFADDDRSLLAEVTDELADAGIQVTDVRTLADAQRGQEESLPSWSLQLAAGLGVACLFLAGLVVIVVAASTWRLRSRDLASMTMAGLEPRTVTRVAVLEPVLAVVVAVAAGVASGLVGAQITLPAIPLLVAEPSGFSLDLSSAWPAVLVVAAVALVALSAVAWAGGLWTAHRAELQRIREVT
jgi:hypothetical protein